VIAKRAAGEGGTTPTAAPARPKRAIAARNQAFCKRSVYRLITDVEWIAQQW
jgi:hypothetical protein